MSAATFDHAQHLHVAWDRDQAAPAGPRRRAAPPGWTAWDRRYLISIARYPLPLSPAQRATLEWVARRAP